MAGRPGFLGGSRGTDADDRGAQAGFDPRTSTSGAPPVHLVNPNGERSGASLEAAPGFDPVWGTLGAPIEQDEDWLARTEEPEGPAIDVDILGDGFEIAGKIHTGQFDRLSGWLNMQTGFIALHEAVDIDTGEESAPPREQDPRTLWVRVDQIVLMAERSPVRRDRPGAPIVQKQRRLVSVVTRGYNLRGNLHLHAHGPMMQFLESPDTHFLPMTDLTVRWSNDPNRAARYQFAMINRDQLVAVMDEPTSN